MRTNENYTLSFYALLLIMACLPLSIKLTSISIVVFLFSYIIESTVKVNFQLNWNLLSLSFLAIFFAIFFSLIYSENMQYAWTNIEKSLSLFLFPLVMVTGFKLSKPQIRLLMNFFAVCQLLLTSICYVVAVIKSGQLYPSYDQQNFYYAFAFARDSYTKPIGGIHPGYFSMYILFSISIILDRILNAQGKRKIIIMSIAVIFLLVNILLLASKIHLVVAFLLILYFTISVEKRSIVRVALLAVVLILMTVGYNDGQIRYRLQNELTYSFEDKYQQWSTALKIWSKSPILGVGVGDFQDALNDLYRENGFKDNLGNNPHNQWLHFLISTGLVGAGLFTFAMFLIILDAFRSRDFACIAFSGIISISMLVESVLATQKGIVFFTIFALLFYSQVRNDSFNRRFRLHWQPFSSGHFRG